MMEVNKPWQILWDGIETSPIIAAAIHDGHGARTDVLSCFALSDAERLREEDPFTAEWTTIVPTRILVEDSRFQLDRNRPRDKAVYQRPEDAWGLTVWNGDGLPKEEIVRSLADYDAFYSEVAALLRAVEQRHGRFVVLDLHTYNHRRNGPAAEPAAFEQNPEVNIGTGTLKDRSIWAPLIDHFISDLRDYDYQGRHLDVRENVKFKGGQFGRWIHETFPDTGCALSIEFKKFFMDEWTGQPDIVQVVAIREALRSTLPGLSESLNTLAGRYPS